MRIDKCGILIVDEGEYEIGGSAWRSWGEVGFWAYYSLYVSSGCRVSDAAYFGAACDVVHDFLGSRLSGYIMACVALGKCPFALV